MPLQLQTHFHDPAGAHRQAYEAGDSFYERLVAAHQGLSDAQSEQLHACLLLLLANHVGDLAVLDEALALARRTVLAAAPPEPEA
jgi:hypothetical protein